MNLKNLREVGAFIDEGVTKKTVTWNKHQFDVLVKNEMSAADFEFLYNVGAVNANGSDHAFAARRVHRLIRVDGGAEVVTYDEALLMKPSLLVALCQVINEVQDKPEETKKKS